MRRQGALGTAIAVPVTGDGHRNAAVAWVEMKPGMFEPRDVKVGARVGDMLQVLSGVKAGEKVAASGAYLIDSESQLKGTGGGHEGMPGMKMDEKGSPAPASGGHEGHGTPAPPKKNGMNMDDMKM